VAAGRSPCPPVLDDFVSPERSAKGTELGIVQIPMERIVGTKTRGRVNSFAPNFMPILAAGTEFSAKWEALCNAHLSDGIREPIKAYEYMDRYYILEGNKRVSVMKYFGSVSIPGTVVRMVPRPNDSKENRLYYEYMHFYSLSQINYLDFSQLGSYKKLQAAMSKGPDETWTDDEKLEFHSFYIRFEDAYRKKGGSKLPMGVSDALLIYLSIYPYEVSRNHMPSVFRNRMPQQIPRLLVMRTCLSYHFPVGGKY
jgi:hypothetical protein